MSRRTTRLGVIVTLFAILMMLAPPAAHANKVTAASGSTMGIAGGIAAGLGVAAMLGCLPCGAIAGGIGIGMGLLQWATAEY